MNLLSITAEILGTATGLAGAWYVAEEGKRAGWGFAAFLASNAAWMAFGYTNGHWGLVATQVGFTFLSLRGMWKKTLLPWLDDPWMHAHDEWRGDVDGERLVMKINHLVRGGGRRADLHTMVGADSPGCFHTHPARAIRVILWGGYVEELEDGTMKAWLPGMVGLVQPGLSHRIHAIENGRCSYSLWIRGRKTHTVQLRGAGWTRGE